MREQVYVDGAGGFGHHVVHKGVRWVAVDDDGEAEVQYCTGVHVGRWVGGMCPMCCSEVSSARMSEEGMGWMSEMLRDRIQARDELMASNIASTQARGAGHSEGVLRQGGIVDRPAGHSAGRIRSRGQGAADSMMWGDGGATEMEICSGSCVMSC